MHGTRIKIQSDILLSVRRQTLTRSNGRNVVYFIKIICYDVTEVLPVSEQLCCFLANKTTEKAKYNLLSLSVLMFSGMHLFK
jgi:hypothetical protein